MKFYKIFKNFIKELINLINLNAYRSIDKIRIIKFINLFKIKIPSNIEMVRVGSKYDGGYVIPNILNQIDFCFSAGIGNNCSFEKELRNFNIKSFGADHTIDQLPENIDGYQFTKKKISSIKKDKNISFENWVNYKASNNKNLLGQIDIEGDEYNLILNTPNKIFKDFKLLVIEFHNVQLIRNSFIYDFYFNALSKILEDFNICHIHINNAEKPTKVRGINVPHVLEVTFLRKDFYEEKRQKVTIPHQLDEKNVPEKDNVFFDDNWLKIITDD